MAFLIDTNVLGRLANLDDPLFSVASHAVTELHRRGETLHITSQNLIEFRSIATRPAAVNGLGLSAADAEAKAVLFEAAFPLLVDCAAIFPAWKSLVSCLGVIGKQVHDARLVAVCHAHGISHLLTFNFSHFQALGGFPPGITIVDPRSV